LEFELKFEFKNLFYSSVAAVVVSCFSCYRSCFSTASGATVSAVAATFQLPGAAFQLHQLSLSELYQKVLQQLQLLLKIKFYRLI
jgi:hypothetical protein